MVQDCAIDLTEDVFLPVRALNELRRKGVRAYEERIIQKYCLPSGRDVDESKREISEELRLTRSVKLTGENTADISLQRDILVSTYSQLSAVTDYPCRRIYIESDLYLKQYEQVRKCMEDHNDREYYLALPVVLRARDRSYLQQLTDRLAGESSKNGIRGMLIRNLEEVSYIRSLGKGYLLVPDAGLYCYNIRSLFFWADYCKEYTIPYELNRKETEKLVLSGNKLGMSGSLIVYSRIPMMVTANCIRRTAGLCNGNRSVEQNISGNMTASDSIQLRDRYDATFPVAVNCVHCYNIIYNSVPYSLHGQETGLNKTGVDVRRYDFTSESAQACRQILSGGDFPFEAFTTGHWKRGVE